MRLNLLVAAAALSLTRCSFDATGIGAESSGVPSTTSGDESTGPVTTTLEPTTGDPTETSANCGNSQLDQGEQCDNGELNNGNAGSICKADCTKNVCGDSYVASNEGCDDGNSVDNDECSNLCKSAGCGDGMPGTGEDCDDGNMVDDDGCTDMCKSPFCGDGNVGAGEVCDDGAMNGNNQACKLDCTPAMCGDSFVQIGVENCDDGNQVDTDDCANDCTLESCGDGTVQMGEQCDDDDRDDTNACTNLCKTPICGDLIKTPTLMEECDLGGMNNDNAACTATCKSAKCGDGLEQTDVEQCDDGNMADNDACIAGCVDAKCGDQIVQVGVEDCDDGNDNNDDGCAACKFTCGNGMLNPDEDCDDGNAIDADFCDTNCKKAAYLVFVTKEKFDGDWGGTDGADALCNAAATTAMLPNAGDYRAWLSDNDSEPLKDFAQSTLPYRRLDGMTVAIDWNDLITGSLLAPISQTETKQVLAGGPLDCNNFDKLVWTNTKPDGSKDSEPYCSGWSTSMDNVKGGLGNALQIGNTWTEGCDRSCNNTARLYCFEQP